MKRLYPAISLFLLMAARVYAVTVTAGITTNSDLHQLGRWGATAVQLLHNATQSIGESSTLGFTCVGTSVTVQTYSNTAFLISVDGGARVSYAGSVGGIWSFVTGPTGLTDASHLSRTNEFGPH